MIRKKQIILIAFTIISSFLAYILVMSSYQFDKDLETFANTTFIVKSLFCIANIGIIVGIFLKKTD